MHPSSLLTEEVQGQDGDLFLNYWSKGESPSMLRTTSTPFLQLAILFKTLESPMHCMPSLWGLFAIFSLRNCGTFRLQKVLCLSEQPIHLKKKQGKNREGNISMGFYVTVTPTEISMYCCFHKKPYLACYFKTYCLCWLLAKIRHVQIKFVYIRLKKGKIGKEKASNWDLLEYRNRSCRVRNFAVVYDLFSWILAPSWVVGPWSSTA